MSNELTANDLTNLELPVAKYTDEKQWGDMITASTYLPRFALFGTTSNLVASGLIQAGHFGVSKNKNDVTDLGSSTDLFPISWRFKAMEIKGEEILSVYDPNSAEFKRMQTQSEVKDSGCMYGAEFLIWVPSLAIFATFYLNSKTMRREAPNLKALLRKPATIKSHLVTKGKYRWYGPQVVQCSTPFALPTPEETLEQATRFANPKESEVEKADSVATDRPQ